jgi:hypothetical protein
MVMYSDAKNYEICPFHSIACLVMTGDGAQYQQPKDKANAISVFTVLAGKGEGGAST